MAVIPALIVPTLSRADLLARMVASIDVAVERLVIVDNGAGAADDVAPAAWHIRLPGNLGVAASWNLGIKATISAPWWVIANDDVVFAPGDLAKLAEHVTTAPGVVWTLDGFAAFALSAHVLERVGWFDENFHPAYVEDCDYEWRCELASVPIRHLDSGLRHAGSSTIAEPAYGTANARTFPTNLAYYEAKWGARIRTHAGYGSPFDRHGTIRDWTLDPRRLRDNRW